MALDIPSGDDRSYQEFVDDARKRIPTLAEAWTDHNVHDPGITIIETLAWLTETYSYQFDRIEDRHLRAYLQLVGERPRPPRPATVRLALSLPPVRSHLDVGRGTAVVSDPGTPEERTFSTTARVALTDARIARVLSVSRGRLTDHTTANDVAGLHYQAFGPRAEAGSQLYLGFAGDPFAGNDRLDLWVTFEEAGLVAPAARVDDTDGSDGHEWLWGGTDEDGDESEGEAESERTRMEEPTSEHVYRPAVTASWEYCADFDRAGDEDAWEPFDDVDDQTTDLYHGGRVGLTLKEPSAETPSAEASNRQPWPATPGTILDEETPYYWIRCTLRPRPTSAGDVEPCQPPASASDSEGTPTHDLPPQFAAVELNVVEAAHLTLVETPTRLRRPDGTGDPTVTTARPGQTFAFDAAPVLDAEVVTSPARGDTVGSGSETTDPSTKRAWDVVSHFDASGPDDDHVRLSRTAGELSFGDGIRGRTPPPNQHVDARRTLVGGGVDGNVPQSATWAYRYTDRDGAGTDGNENGAERLVDATALTDATGGGRGEIPAEAFARVRRSLSEPSRAVTLSDYRQLAVETPGLRVGRAAATDGTDTAPEECVGSNEVRVVVVPFSTRDRPEPSEAFLTAVRCHLKRHALLTDRVVVEPPRYVGVGVGVDVELQPGTVATAVTPAVEAALDAFLAPLGDESDESDESDDGEKGWPFGRPLYPSEVYEVVDSVPGVDCVFDVRFTVEGPGRFDDDGVVHIPETGLPYPLAHDVSVRTDSASCRGEWR